ncbi:M50 family metallopeptidase [Plantactinospora sp. GCM10030261]|uniref:M50 family metallopeptidase n=1 Tax=Plantactinospora sp. GCM10030261 TaxID=3273420 RepID=UPI00361F517C
MLYVLGVVVIALGILISVSLHEAGHLLTAKAFGMKVTKYFVGFGPTLWSFRRGETEYGIKGIPLGGFCKIVGMTPQDDDVDPADEHRVMWRYPVWKRTVVMASGSAAHFALAIIGAWMAAMFVGLPNPAYPDTDAEARQEPAVIAVGPCLPADPARTACQPGDPASPAGVAQLRDGDRVTSFDGKPVTNYGDLLVALRGAQPGDKVTIRYERDGSPGVANVTMGEMRRPPLDDPKGPVGPVAALGVGLLPTTPGTLTYGPIDAVGASADFTGTMAVETVRAIQRIPEKVPALFAAIGGAERDVDTPISVVGASRLGGEALEAGVWQMLVFLFISLNFFIGVFNLLPLLPVDGGHIAIAWFERVRSWVYARLGKPDPGRVDYLKLMPLTYAVILVGGSFMLLTITADVVNPITLFSR